MIEYTVEVSADGDKYWYLNGKLHREDGPAVESADGDKHWYLNGKVHREGGPAMEHASGNKHWYLNSKLHREDGPAIECVNGYNRWYLNGEKVTEEEHKRRMNPVKELTVEEISNLLGYEVKVVR